jgi:hypothetical protein
MTYIDYAMPNEDYHNKELHPHLSSSDIKEVEKTSPLHWALKLEQPRKAPTPAMLAGSAIHAMISEPEKELFIRGLPDRRKRTEWAKLEEQAAKKGQTVLTEGEFDECQRIADTAIDTCVELQAALGEKDLAVEASIFTQCTWSDLKIKCRPDMMSLSKRTMWDIKTTTDNTKDNFPREIKRWSYDMQAAFYLHCAACAGLVIDRFIFLAVDKPTGVCVAYELSELYLKHAEKRMARVLDKLVEAESQGKFETGWERVNTIHLPSWMEDELDAF